MHAIYEITHELTKAWNNFKGHGNPKIAPKRVKTVLKLHYKNQKKASKIGEN